MLRIDELLTKKARLALTPQEQLRAWMGAHGYNNRTLAEEIGGVTRDLVSRAVRGAKTTCTVLNWIENNVGLTGFPEPRTRED